MYIDLILPVLIISWSPMTLAHLLSCYALLLSSHVPNCCVYSIKGVNRDSSARKYTFDSNRYRFYHCVWAPHKRWSSYQHTNGALKIVTGIIILSVVYECWTIIQYFHHQNLSNHYTTPNIIKLITEKCQNVKIKLPLPLKSFTNFKVYPHY